MNVYLKALWDAYWPFYKKIIHLEENHLEGSIQVPISIISLLTNGKQSKLKLLLCEDAVYAGSPLALTSEPQDTCNDSFKKLEFGFTGE